MICQSKTLCGKENTRRTALVFLNEKVNNVLNFDCKTFLKIGRYTSYSRDCRQKIFTEDTMKKKNYGKEFEKILRLLFTKYLTLHLIYIV